MFLQHAVINWAQAGWASNFLSSMIVSLSHGTRRRPFSQWQLDFTRGKSAGRLQPFCRRFEGNGTHEKNRLTRTCTMYSAMPFYKVSLFPCLLSFIDKLIAHVILLMVNRTWSVKLTEVHLGEVLLLSWCGGRCHWAEYGHHSGDSKISGHLICHWCGGMLVTVSPTRLFSFALFASSCSWNFYQLLT